MTGREKRIDLEIPEPRYAVRDVREAWETLGRVSLRKVAASAPAMLVAHHRGLYPVFSLGGGFYAGALQGDPSTGSVAGDVAAYAGRLAHFGSGSESFERLGAMERNVLVVGQTVCERIDEPVWTVSVSNSSFKGDRPLQIRAALQVRRPFRTGLAPSEAHAVAFRADRKADLDVFVRRLKERHPYSTVFPDFGRCQAVVPEALGIDDFGMSVRALARALTASAHKALPLLPLAAVETWMDLRRLAAAGDAAAFARAADAMAPLLRLASLADDPEADRWRRRAALQADMLALRLGLEPHLAAEAEDILQGPSP